MTAEQIVELQTSLLVAQAAWKQFVEDFQKIAEPGTPIAWKSTLNGKPILKIGTIESYCEDYSAWVKVDPSGASVSMPLGHLIPRLVAYSG